ncbi:MAG: HAD-IB family hydrolase [Candidatus Adlerbacteria bacterium]|nr:HAD-IB family hydrolase [Candidatus Adlerbacteria bacterium]
MFRLFFVEFCFFIFAVIFYIPTSAVALLMPKRKRPIWWRKMSIALIKTSLFLAGVRVRVINRPPSGDEGPYIYASNHPTHQDGLILQTILGPHVVPITAPLEQFPSIIATWMRNVGAIDILRDDIDKARYKHSHTKREALDKALGVLQGGESLIIFPEGHTEMLEALYYFHTGAARLSLAAGVPIQPIVIKNAHTVLTNTCTWNKGVITFSFERKVAPDSTYGESILCTTSEPLRQKVRDLTARLEHEFLKELPLRSMHDQRTSATDVGVFVDIDMTLYQGLSQLDFIIHLVEKKLITLSQGLSVFGFFVLGALGIISHETMMRRAMQMLAGWNTKAVEKIIHRFFLHIALPKIQYGLFSILEDHLAKGHKLVFVSEAIHPLAQAFADFFEADGAIDTSLKRRGKTYTGDIMLLRRGETKALGVISFVEEHNINLKKSYAYADSFSDVPFLLLVGYPTAVHPDRKLRRFASSHAMRILKHVS